jgi:hypothetical protein
VGFLKYVKSAFLYHWNLLAFLGASTAALLSGAPDVLLPLVAAAELAYLGTLAANPKYQAYVEAQEAKAARSTSTASAQRTLESITRSLPRDLLERFESLRKQCLELQQIAAALKTPASRSADVPLESFQVAGLDRLLWIHLRLLYTQFALARFLQKTSEQRIRDDMRLLEQRLKDTPADETKPQIQRVRKALEDNLETSRSRLANLAKARDNYELVQLEIDRLENKIRSLSELAVNRQEPDFISGQVDQVAASMLDTERTMSELKFATGLDDADEQAPELLRPVVAELQH